MMLSADSGRPVDNVNAEPGDAGEDRSKGRCGRVHIRRVHGSRQRIDELRTNPRGRTLTLTTLATSVRTLQSATGVCERVRKPNLVVSGLVIVFRVLMFGMLMHFARIRLRPNGITVLASMRMMPMAAQCCVQQQD